jgi:transposase
LPTREIAELEQAIMAAFTELGHAPSHFPVGSAVALAALVAEAGDPSRFRSAKEFVAHFGWCPADTQSGMYKAAHPPLSKAGNRYARRTIWLLAIVAVRHNAAYRTYFDQRTTAGKNKMNTLVAIGRNLLCTIFITPTNAPPEHPRRFAVPQLVRKVCPCTHLDVRSTPLTVTWHCSCLCLGRVRSLMSSTGCLRS